MAARTGYAYQERRRAACSPVDYNTDKMAQNSVEGESRIDVMAEFGRRQNPYLVRDNSPQAVEIKSYFLNLLNAKGPLSFDDVGCSVFSQNNEDGILLYIFSKIGFKARKSLEIGCNVDNTTIGLPEGNTVNLIVHFGFHGLIIDMNAGAVGALRHFFASCFSTRHFHQAPDLARKCPSDYYSPVILASEVTPDNVDRLLAENGFSGEIDLLSIDVDGIDILLFEAISACSPRVVLIEVNSRLPFEERRYRGPEKGRDVSTVAHRQDAGVSLADAVARVEARGYVFVGMNNNLINAFFLRSDLHGNSGLARATVADYVNHPLRPPESFVAVRPQP